MALYYHQIFLCARLLKCLKYSTEVFCFKYFYIIHILYQQWTYPSLFQLKIAILINHEELNQYYQAYFYWKCYLIIAKSLLKTQFHQYCFNCFHQSSFMYFNTQYLPIYVLCFLLEHSSFSLTHLLYLWKCFLSNFKSFYLEFLKILSVFFSLIYHLLFYHLFLQFIFIYAATIICLRRCLFSCNFLSKQYNFNIFLFKECSPRNLI